MNTLNSKSNIVEIPSYNDGYFDLYRIIQAGIYPIEQLELIATGFAFKEQSIGDQLKYNLKARDVDVAFKLLIEQEKSIDSLNVLKIGNALYHVLNSYHFTDTDGFDKTRLTLETYNLIGV